MGTTKHEIDWFDRLTKQAKERLDDNGLFSLVEEIVPSACGIKPCSHDSYGLASDYLTGEAIRLAVCALAPSNDERREFNIRCLDDAIGLLQQVRGRMRREASGDSAFSRERAGKE